MAHRTRISLAAVAALASMAASTAAFADRNGRTFATRLSGYGEAPLTINSNGSGVFTATVSKDGTEIHYTLSYRDLSSDVTQAHIHFGRPAIAGMIVLFLCTNLTPPDGVPEAQKCPQAPATISGKRTAADVIARTAQGIDAGAEGLKEMAKAMRVSAAYANVHTTKFGPGEIRGTIGPDDEDEDED